MAYSTCNRVAAAYAGMWAPGAVGLVLGVLLLLTVRDSPEAVGYLPVEAVKEV